MPQTIDILHIEKWMSELHERLEFDDIYEAWGSLNHPEEVV